MDSLLGEKADPDFYLKIIDECFSEHLMGLIVNIKSYFYRFFSYPK